MASSFDAQQKLEALITNDTTPSMSTIDILSSLKLIEHWEGRTKAANPADPSAKIAKEELKYLSAAMQAMGNNPALTNRFGSGFQGAMAISSLLKQKQAERVYNKIIEGVLDQKDSGLELDSVIGKVNTGSGSALSGGS